MSTHTAGSVDSPPHTTLHSTVSTTHKGILDYEEATEGAPSSPFDPDRTLLESPDFTGGKDEFQLHDAGKFLEAAGIEVERILEELRTLRSQGVLRVEEYDYVQQAVEDLKSDVTAKLNDQILGLNNENSKVRSGLDDLRRQVEAWSAALDQGPAEKALQEQVANHDSRLRKAEAALEQPSKTAAQAEVMRRTVTKLLRDVDKLHLRIASLEEQKQRQREFLLCNHGRWDTPGDDDYVFAVIVAEPGLPTFKTSFELAIYANDVVGKHVDVDVEAFRQARVSINDIIAEPEILRSPHLSIKWEGSILRSSPLIDMLYDWYNRYDERERREGAGAILGQEGSRNLGAQRTDLHSSPVVYKEDAASSSSPDRLCSPTEGSQVRSDEIATATQDQSCSQAREIRGEDEVLPREAQLPGALAAAIGEVPHVLQDLARPTTNRTWEFAAILTAVVLEVYALAFAEQDGRLARSWF